MEQLSESHLRYLLSIYGLGQTTLDVSATGIAKALNVTKPSVTHMLDNLMGKKLLVKERYGKVYLTDAGFLLAKNFRLRVDKLLELLPVLGLELTDAERLDAACLLAASLPEHTFSALGIQPVIDLTV